MAVIIKNPIAAIGFGSGSKPITENGLDDARKWGYIGNGAGDIDGCGYGNGNMALYPIEVKERDETSMNEFAELALASILDEKDEMDGSGGGDSHDDIGYGCGFGEDRDYLLAEQGCMFGEPVMPEYMDIDGYDRWNDEFYLRLQIRDDILCRSKASPQSNH